MAIRANHPWLYNYLQLPFYTGDRFKFLPFNMYPGHRGYGAVGGSQGILPQNMLQQFVPLLNSLFGNIKFGAVRTKKSAAVPPGLHEARRAGRHYDVRHALNMAKLYSGLYAGAPITPEIQKQIDEYADFLRRVTEMILDAGQDVRDISRFIAKDPLSLKALLSKIVKSPASKYIAPGVAASGLAAWVLGPRVQEALRSNPPSAPVPPVPQEALRSNPPSAPVPPVPAVDVTPVDPAESTKLLGVDVPKNPNILLHPLSYHPMLSGAALGGLLGSIYLTSKHKKKYKSLGERLTSPEMFYGLAAGGLSGAALGAAIHNYAKFMRGE